MSFLCSLFFLCESDYPTTRLAVSSFLWSASNLCNLRLLLDGVFICPEETSLTSTPTQCPFFCQNVTTQVSVYLVSTHLFASTHTTVKYKGALFYWRVSITCGRTIKKPVSLGGNYSLPLSFIAVSASQGTQSLLHSSFAENYSKSWKLAENWSVL